MQFRMLWEVKWTRAASSYVVSIPYAADPTKSTKITIALPGQHANKQAAAEAAAHHLDTLTEAELQVLLYLEMRGNDPLERASN
ncbi:MAG TPA: hypothetical protein VGM50_23075 [Gemmatimonadaceae bacterium]|jgi:hypothetical protein